jgi:hypothetical protein
LRFPAPVCLFDALILLIGFTSFILTYSIFQGVAISVSDSTPFFVPLSSSDLPNAANPDTDPAIAATREQRSSACHDQSTKGSVQQNELMSAVLDILSDPHLTKVCVCMCVCVCLSVCVSVCVFLCVYLCVYVFLCALQGPTNVCMCVSALNNIGRPACPASHYLWQDCICNFTSTWQEQGGITFQAVKTVCHTNQRA